MSYAPGGHPPQGQYPPTYGDEYEQPQQYPPQQNVNVHYAPPVVQYSSHPQQQYAPQPGYGQQQQGYGQQQQGYGQQPQGYSQPQQQQYAAQGQQWEQPQAGVNHNQVQFNEVPVGVPLEDGEIAHKKEMLNYSQEGGNPGSKYKDVWFIVAFGIHLVLMIALACYYGPKLNTDSSSSTTAGDDVNTTPTGTLIGLLVVSAVVGIFFSIFWLNVMKRFSSKIIHASLIAGIVMGIVGLVVSFATGSIALGVFFIFSVLISCVYYYFVRARIPFATAILQSSVAAIQEHHGPILVVYGLSVLQLGWLALWAFIFVSIYTADSTEVVVLQADGTYATETQRSSTVEFFEVYAVFSLYWVSQVIRNIGHTTTAGVVASWWFVPSVTSPTSASFKRSVTTSFGSICFGSLIVSLIQTIRFLLHMARRDACRDIVDCLLRMIERAVKWFASYAYCVVAIYGESFVDSARRTGELMKAQLFTAIINDDLSDMVLFMGSFLAGVVAGVVGCLWAASKDDADVVVFGLLAFIVGFLVAALAMSVLASAVQSTFVAWASDPAVLLHNRPVEFGRILDAASGRYANQGLQQYSGQTYPGQHQQA